MCKENNRIINIDEIIEIENLIRAYKKAKRKNNIAGSDGISPKNIDNSIMFVHDLYKELHDGRYSPKEVIKESVMKYDETCMVNFDILCFSDRVIQMAIKNKLLPLFNKDLLDGVCGYRGKGYKKKYFEYIEKFWKNNYSYIVSFDIKNFFGSIDKQILIKILEKYCDSESIELIENELYRDSNVIMPLGHILSPLLSNIYLNDIDHIMYDLFGEFIRFGDNYIFPIKDDIEKVKYVEYMLNDQLKNKNMELNKNKTLVIKDYRNIGIL